MRTYKSRKSVAIATTLSIAIFALFLNAIAATAQRQTKPVVIPRIGSYYIYHVYLEDASGNRPGEDYFDTVTVVSSELTRSGKSKVIAFASKHDDTTFVHYEETGDLSIAPAIPNFERFGMKWRTLTFGSKRVFSLNHAMDTIAYVREEKIRVGTTKLGSSLVREYIAPEDVFASRPQIHMRWFSPALGFYTRHITENPTLDPFKYLLGYEGSMVRELIAYRLK